MSVAHVRIARAPPLSGYRDYRTLVPHKYGYRSHRVLCKSDRGDAAKIMIETLERTCNRLIYEPKFESEQPEWCDEENVFALSRFVCLLAIAAALCTLKYMVTMDCQQTDAQSYSSTANPNRETKP